ncbi:MAG: ABC transporter permease [Melioribacteraceae bacterium]|nr:ABC transporter permease [Melioribacteraceae bacterium]
MNKIFHIAKWEFVEKLKTKSFLIYMILFPTILFSISLLPSLMDKHENVSKTIGVVDLSNKYSATLHENFETLLFKNGRAKFLSVNIPQIDYSSMKEKNYLSRLNISAIILLEEINGSTQIEINQLSFLADDELIQIKNILKNSVTKAKLVENEISPVLLKEIDSGIKIILNNTEITDDEDAFLKTFFSSYLFILLFVLMIIFSGGQLIRSLVEEKSSRIIEVLLSSCSMKELLAGKILGLTFLGFFQLFVWIFIIGGLIKSNSLEISLMNNLLFQLVFFVLGYILFSSIFIGAGALVSSEQEAQHVTSYISISLIFPILFSVQVLSYPDSLLAKVLTYFPFTTAPTMILKLNVQNPSFSELITSATILLFSIYLVITLTAKIFSRGILSISRRPRLTEIKEWIFKGNK